MPIPTPITTEEREKFLTDLQNLRFYHRIDPYHKINLKAHDPRMFKELIENVFSDTAVGSYIYSNFGLYNTKDKEYSDRIRGFLFIKTRQDGTCAQWDITESDTGFFVENYQRRYGPYKSVFEMENRLVMWPREKDFGVPRPEEPSKPMVFTDTKKSSKGTKGSNVKQDKPKDRP